MTTFKEKFDGEVRWYGKIIIMELYHLTQLSRNIKWTHYDTARYFGLGRATVTENLKIAKAIHDNYIHNEVTLDKLRTREEAACAINTRTFRGKS